MVNEEAFLRDKIGQKNPFKIPDGYFDQFADRLMEKLPEQQHKPILIRRLRPLLYAAVFVGVLIIGATLAFKSIQKFDSQSNIALVTNEQDESLLNAYSDTYIEDAANYAMIDNEEIYAYLADY